MKFAARCTGRTGCDCLGHRRYTSPQNQKAMDGHIRAAPVRGCSCEVCRHARSQRA